MKKIFFVAIAATLLAAGCQKTEVINQVNPVDGTSMTFAPNLGKLTKAATAEGTGMNNLQEQDFRLWAYYVADDANRGAKANTIYDKMGNIAIENTGTEWSTSPTHFWPGKGKQLKFFAVSADQTTYGTAGKVKAYKDNDPDAANDADTKVTINPDSKTLTITDFMVDPEDPNDDLMIADYVVGEQKNGESGSNAVDLKFRHALAKVEFLFKNEMAKDNDDNAVIVQHMYVKDIVTKGTVTVTEQKAALELANWQLSDVKGRFGGDFNGANTTVPQTYTTADNIEQYTGTGNDKLSVPTTNAMLLTKTNQSYTTWLVIPQSVGSADKSLEVTIAYLIGTRQFVATFPLYTTNAASWNPNQYIKYNISLSPNMIGFNPTVEDWTPVNEIEDSEKGDNAVNDPTNDGKDVVIN